MLHRQEATGRSELHFVAQRANGRTTIDFFDIVEVVYRTKPAEVRGFV